VTAPLIDCGSIYVLSRLSNLAFTAFVYLSFRFFHKSIETHFTIEPRSFYEEEASQADNPSTVRAPSKPMKGLMTTYGYLLPDPQNPVRYTVWFTGGTVAPKVEPDPAAAKLSSSTTKQSSDSLGNRGSKEGLRRNRRSSKEDKIGGGDDSFGSNRLEQQLQLCTLPLHECKRKNKVCAVHGTHAILCRVERLKQQKSEERYARPRYGKGSRAGLGNSLLNGGGAMLPSLSSKLGEWEDIFAPDDTWRRSWSEQTKAFAAWVLLGAEVPDHMEDDGSMNYTLKRPIGGHNITYIDVLYLDETLRITRGNYGSYYVQTREVPSSSSSKKIKKQNNSNGSKDNLRRRKS
jgi:hypothetical protein